MSTCFNDGFCLTANFRSHWNLVGFAEIFLGFTLEESAQDVVTNEKRSLPNMEFGSYLS